MVLIRLCYYVSAPDQVRAALISSHEVSQQSEESGCWMLCTSTAAVVQHLHSLEIIHVPLCFVLKTSAVIQLTTLIVPRICFATDPTGIYEIFVERLQVWGHAFRANHLGRRVLRVILLKIG